MNEAYFVAIDGKQFGLYKGQQIRNKLASGKVRESDFIWRDGLADWVSISSLLEEFPGADPPPLPEANVIRHLTITHPNELDPTELEVPEKGIYEPPATLSQKNKLMKLGCKSPDALRNLGRDQASFMIDVFSRDTDAVVAYELEKRRKENKRRQGKMVLIAIAVIILGFLGIVLLYRLLEPIPH